MQVKTAAAVALALCASSVVAQTNTSEVDIAALDIGTKTSWCNAQFDTCNTLCGSPTQNSCDNPTLKFDCTCANGSAPGLQYYTQTIPTFLCEQVHTQCIAANTMNSTAQADCDKAEKDNCGHLAATPGSSSGDSSSSASSPSSTAANSGATNAASNTASQTDAVTSTSSTGAAATMMALGREIGSGVLAAGVAVAVML